MPLTCPEKWSWERLSMLDVMRKNAGSLLIKIILGLIIVVFVLWGVGSPPSQKPKFVKVNDLTISQPQHSQAYTALLERARKFSGEIDEGMEGVIKQQALDQLINLRLLESEARNLNLQVSDQELLKAVADMPLFQQDGQFDPQRYRQVLQRNRIDTQQFESDVRTNLLVEKVRIYYTGSIKTSKEEARQWYRWQNKEVLIEYALFKADAKKDVEIGEEEIKSHFETNQQRYETPAQRKVRYLQFSPLSFESQVEISQEEIESYYESNTSEFDNPKTVEARHILIKAAQDADAEADAAAKQKAEDVFAKTQQNSDFEALAKEFSEGPTASQGGYLGAFERERMVKPFADQAFAMKAGEISTPVRTQFGYHIIKVEKVNEAKTATLEESTGQIREKLTDSKSENLAYEKAGEIFDAALANNDLEKLAKEYGLELKQTGAFSRGGPENVVDKSQFAQTAFELSLLELSDIVELGDSFYIMQVTEIADPRIPALEEVLEKVKQDLQKDKKDRMARQDAEAVLAKAKEGTGMAEQGQEVNTSDFFSRRQPIKGIGYDPAIFKAVFELTEQAPLASEVVKGQAGYYVINLKETRLPDDQKFEQEAETIISQLRQQKQTQYFQKWIEDLRNNSKIEMDKGFLG